MPLIKLFTAALQLSFLASLVIAGPIPKRWKSTDTIVLDAKSTTSVGHAVSNLETKSTASAQYTGPRSVRGNSFNTSATSVTRIHPRDLLGDNILKLDSYLKSAGDYSSILQTLAIDAKSGKFKANDARLEHHSADAMNGFAGAIHSFQVLFKHMGREKGLANYNRNSQLQTSLKQLVNLNKDTLEAIDCLVYELPYLGPVLGPIVYELKCLLDLILNSLENLSDAILNEIEPLLQACVGSAVQTTCTTGFSVLGLCVGNVLGGGIGGLL